MLPHSIVQSLLANYKKNIKFSIDSGWPSLASEKQNTTPHDSLGTVTSTSPMDIRATNFFKLDKTAGVFEHILVIIGQLTRYTQAYTNTNKSAKNIAKNISMILC